MNTQHFFEIVVVVIIVLSLVTIAVTNTIMVFQA